MLFQYSARTKLGKRVDGNVEAKSKIAAVEAVERLGCVPFSIVPETARTRAFSDSYTQVLRASSSDGPTGVAGWLLLLCLLLTVIGPLGTLITLLKSWQDASPLLQTNQLPHIDEVMVIDTCVAVFITALSVIAGISLWTIKPYAITLARGFLRLCLLYHLILVRVLFMFVAMSSLPPGQSHLPKDVWDASAMVGNPFAVVSAVAWLFYLRRSRRVKNTY